MNLGYVHAAINAARADQECLMHWRRAERTYVFLAALDAVPGGISAQEEYLPIEAYEIVYTAAMKAVARVLKRRGRVRRG